MKTVRILGTARNLRDMPPPPPGVEVWCSNDPLAIRQRLRRVLEQDEWTRWFNLHSRAHQLERYPGDRTARSGFTWFQAQDGTRPIYNQKRIPEIPGSIEFPLDKVLDYAKNRYFTFTGCLLAAFARIEGFERVEFHGFRLSDSKPNEAYKFERPCFFYWVKRLRDEGVDVWFPPEVAALPFEPGDPTLYTGTLYGYETKPELEL
jgi:hypothetical protein